MLFRDVSGGQIGNHNTQRNEFVYTVAPTASARRWLADNRDLAKALIDYAFPARGSGDAAALGRAFTSALDGARLDPGDGRVRSEHYDLPAQGSTLRIRAHDGVSIGERSTISRDDRVAVNPAEQSSVRRSIDRAAHSIDRAAAREKARAERDAARRTEISPREGPSTGRGFRP